MRILFSRHLLLSILLVPLLAGCKQKPIVYPDANVSHPPKVGIPFVAGTFFSLKKFGYEQKEFFFRGEAKSYKNVGTLTSDGKWQVEAADSAIYKSRMLVYRPKNPADFNGTVLVEWLNVTGGLDTATDWILLHNEIMRRGYAWVGISAQRVGVEGGKAALPTPLGFSLSLKLIEPYRYGSLKHPGDSFSYDIFTQAARAVRHPTGIAPLGDLKVKHMIAMGESQSAARMMTYIDALGKDNNLFDGYFVHSRLGNIPAFGGASAPLSEAPQTYIPTAPVVLVRDDLDKPVMNMQTETDVVRLGTYPDRQEDTDYFRLWEVAGTSHADQYIIAGGGTDQGGVKSAKIVITQKPQFIIPACPEPVNSAPQQHFVGQAALHALNAWIVNGTAPPSFPRLVVNNTGDGFEYDAYGNVLGGVRSPYVDVPVAQFSGLNSSVQTNNGSLCFLFGKTQMLDDATLKSLYPDQATYVSEVTQSVAQDEANGSLLPEDGDLIIQAAQESNIPPQ